MTRRRPSPSSEEMKAVLKWRDEQKQKGNYRDEWVALTVESESPPKVTLLSHDSDATQVRKEAAKNRNPNGPVPVFMKMPASASEDILM